MSYQLRNALIIAIFILGSYSIAKPFLADYHYSRGMDLEETEYSTAVASYQKAIDLDPSNAEYHSKLGHIYLRRARSTPPKRAVHGSPSTVHGQQSTTNGQRSTQQLAADCYQKAIDLCPNNGNYWLGLGMVYEQVAKLKAQGSKVKGLAASCFEKATSLDPNNAFFRTMLGSFHIRNGNKEEGLQEYEKAITCLPKIHLYDFLKGKDVEDDFLDTAIRGLKKAIELYPGDADIYTQLGAIYVKKGMYDEAIGQYEHALKLKPEHKGFRRTLESLKKQHSSH